MREGGEREGERERNMQRKGKDGQTWTALESRLNPACCSSVAAESLPGWADLFMNGGELRQSLLATAIWTASHPSNKTTNTI